MTSVAEIMSCGAPCLDVDSTLEEAALAMSEARTEALPLADAAGTFLGVVARRDILRASRSLGDLARSMKAKDLMDPDAPTIGINDRIEKAMAEMAIHQVQHLPVLDGAMVSGMLSSADIAQAAPLVQIEQLIEHVALIPDQEPLPARRNGL
ncbi:CBS domain-containing protein [Nesterenkonia lutea]|uniref:CBS domain-containing protein n=1 Tax=Nesterenkonia lutea TaxID=272919 RepID=A0ABR9JC55_9MICC|nr:CBS domain-containing protein [Nesterenkonia lutea]MBE1523365.1 CBS domain-containing protein [Nesterenkonia lutea]